MRFPSTAAVCLLLAACDGDRITAAPVSPDSGVPVLDAGFDEPDAGFPADLGFAPDAAEPPPAREPIYIHTGDTLFSFDLMANRPVEIGKFQGPNGPITRMVDLAIDLTGRLYGGTSDLQIYQCDPETAACVHRFEFDDRPNGMTFLSDGRLIIAGDRVSAVNPRTGQKLEEIAGTRAYQTSGDVVGLPDGKLYWTVRNMDAMAGDGVVQIDPRTGDSRWLGAARVARIFGLGYASGELIGFSDEGFVVRLDPATGTVRDLRMLPGRWWGATTNPVLWD